jgi:hypothetical protein
MSEAMKKRLKAIERRIPKWPFPDLPEVSDEKLWEIIQKVLTMAAEPDADEDLRRTAAEMNAILDKARARMEAAEEGKA